MLALYYNIFVMYSWILASGLTIKFKLELNFASENCQDWVWSRMTQDSAWVGSKAPCLCEILCLQFTCILEVMCCDKTYRKIANRGCSLARFLDFSWTWPSSFGSCKACKELNLTRTNSEGTAKAWLSHRSPEFWTSAPDTLLEWRVAYLGMPWNTPSMCGNSKS